MSEDDVGLKVEEDIPPRFVSPAPDLLTSFAKADKLALDEANVHLRRDLLYVSPHALLRR
jgi:hypothetical protein